MTSPSIVRPAIPADEPEIWNLLRMAHAENALIKMSERKVQYHLDRFLEPRGIGLEDFGPRGFIGVIGPIGTLEGIIMLSIGSPWFSDEVTMDDNLNFVHPKCRRSDHAKALLAFAKRIVDQIRSDYPTFQMTVGILSTERTAAKIKLYERQNLTLAGGIFVYPPPADVKPLGQTLETR